MIDPCFVDLLLHLLDLMERECTGDMNPYCRELMATIEWLREANS